MEKLPAYSYDLIKQLDKEIPNATPQVTDSEREVWIRVGKRMLIDHLLSAMDEPEGLPNVLSHS
jgi:hypothetical protein